MIKKFKHVFRKGLTPLCDTSRGYCCFFYHILAGWLVKKGELHPKAVSTSAINMKMTRASFLLSRGNLQDSYLLTNKWTSGPQCIVVHYFMFVFHTKVLEDEKNVR